MSLPIDPGPVKLPRYLQDRARTVRLGDDVPALVAHPDWESPVPVVIWMHGRTVFKELDSGRYLRWIRAGFAAVALDLPGHGERLDRSSHSPDRTLDTLEQMAGEIDGVIADLPALGPFDLSRLGIGGMSAGGMAALVRLTSPHDFGACVLESTTGDLAALYFGSGLPPGSVRPWPTTHERQDVARIDPARHLETFRPIPLLAVHSETDEVVPWAGQRLFLSALKDRYSAAGKNPGLIEIETYATTGAPSEHAGFGQRSNDAKTRQTRFLSRTLNVSGWNDEEKDPG